MNQFVVNIIHRPEMAPEYAERESGHGNEDLGCQTLRTGSLDAFRTRQMLAHKYGLKTTILMTYASLFNAEAAALAKEHRETCGDEIALSLMGLSCEQFREKYRTEDFCIRMFSMEDKKAIVRDVFEKFREVFGFYPESIGSCCMDAELINYIKAEYPSVKCAVAICLGEGPKTCRSTSSDAWHPFMEGGPWAPWIPSRANTYAPAANEKEDSGIVAVPYLSRDLLACCGGSGSDFGVCPQNVPSGMICENEIRESPDLDQLIDRYRSLAKYNDGDADRMLAGPGRMDKMERREQPCELPYQSCEDAYACCGRLKQEGKLLDLTTSEFADRYRAVKSYTTPECALWQDVLYGPDKQLFWYCDPYMRVCVDMDQGGAIVDLRPYAAKLERPVGIGTARFRDASYPFLIRKKHRGGSFPRDAGEGTVRSAKVCWKGEEAELCSCRTKAHFSREGEDRILTLDPVEIEFSGGLTVRLQTVITFSEGSANIRIDRTILSLSDPAAELTVKEYLTGCCGAAEYSEDMSALTLHVEAGEEDSVTIPYEDKCREAAVPGAEEISCTIPPIKTRVSMLANGRNKLGFVRTGCALSPAFTLGWERKLKEGEVFSTWLNLERAD